MESPPLPQDVCDSADNGVSPEAHETVVNPFEFPGLLANHALSPDTCTFKISTPSTNSAKKTPARFRWSIDQMANLQPAEIHPEEIHRQALYLSTVSLDQELEEKTQLEIEQFFSRGAIVPSPWTQSDNKEPARKQYANSPMDPLEESPTAKPSTNLGKTCDVACQTTISLPMGFDLEALLADFRRREDSLCSDGSGLSLRRKLFVDNTEDSTCSNSTQSVHTPPPFQTNHSSPTLATLQMKDRSSERGMHNTEQFSSSPIRASYGSMCVCTPDSEEVHVKTEDPSSLPSPIHMREEVADAVSSFDEKWTDHLSPSPTNSHFDKPQRITPTSQTNTKYPSPIPSLQTVWISPEAPKQAEIRAIPSSPHSQSPPLASVACPQVLNIISPIASVKLQKLTNPHITGDAGDDEACDLKDLGFSTINVHKCNEDTFSDSQKYVCAEFSLQGNRTENMQETEFSIDAQLTGELKLPEIMSSTYNTGTQSNASELVSSAQFTCGAHFENEPAFKKQVKSGLPNETDGCGYNEEHCNDGRATVWDLSTRTRSCEDGFGVPMEVTRGNDWVPPRHATKGLAFLHPQAESSCLPNEVDSGYSTYHMPEEEMKVKDVSTMEVDPSYVDSGYSTYHMPEEEMKVKDVSTMEVDPSYVCATAPSDSYLCH